MAYPIAAGQPQRSGVWIPEIWSTNINIKLYDSTVLSQISNNKWSAEISDQGDKVIIRQRPDITVRQYVKGQKLIHEQPESTNITLLIDKGYYWDVVVDDVDKKQQDIEWASEFIADAAEQIKIAMDTDVLGTIYADAHSTNRGLTAGRKSASLNLGVTGTPLALDKTNVLDSIVDCATALDENNVPETGRWMVIPPIFAGLIKKSDLKDASLTGDGTSVMRNGRIGTIDRFTLYASNLLATASDGGHTCYNMLFGHANGLTLAEQIPYGKIERLRHPDTFGEIIRGLCVYGYKVNHPQSIGNLYAYKA